jgi:hypothetical protein
MDKDLPEEPAPGEEGDAPAVSAAHQLHTYRP